MSLSYFRIIMTVFRLEKATQKWIHFCTCSNLEKELNCYRNIFFSLSISVSLECMIFYFSKSVQLYISYVINIMISYSLQKSMQLIEDSKHCRNDQSSCQVSILWTSVYPLIHCWFAFIGCFGLIREWWWCRPRMRC